MDHSKFLFAFTYFKTNEKNLNFIAKNHKRPLKPKADKGKLSRVIMMESQNPRRVRHLSIETKAT